MSLLSDLFKQDQSKDLQDLQNNFDHYAYTIFEKVSIIAEIKNKYYDICKKSSGYLSDEQAFAEFDRKDKAYIFFKKWVNTRLKRVNKILHLEIKSEFATVKQAESIAGLFLKMQSEYQSKNDTRVLCELLLELSQNLQKQIEIIDKIYPLKMWTLQAHKDLISDHFTDLCKSEIQLVFGVPSTSLTNYNVFPAIVAKGLHDTQRPVNSILNRLINARIQRLKEKNAIDKTMIVCYHARPIYIGYSLFPLHVVGKEAGFFVSTSYDEAKEIVMHLYNLTSSQVEVFKITLPQHIFARAIKDLHSDEPFHELVTIEHSYIIRPTQYPFINEYYIKGLITIEKASPRQTTS